MITPDLSAAEWRKSSRSSAQGGNCVEVAGMTAMVAVRDSKDPDGPALGFSRPAFGTLMRQVKAGRFDL